MSEIKGPNFVVVSGNQAASFFGVMGIRDGKHWYSNILIDAIQMLMPALDTHPSGVGPIPRDTITPLINSNIDRLMQAGIIIRLDRIQVSAYGAMCLYLENILLYSMFEDVTQNSPDSIDVPNVDVNGRKVTFQIMRTTHSILDVVAVDGDGKVL